jgi:protein-tyrosine phosphatase
MLRSVRLPSGVAGRLRLHSMPGRREPLEQVWEQIRSEGVQVIVCLAGRDEIRAKSPAYAAALETNTVPCTVEPFPVVDFGVPKDREAFWSLASQIAEQLRVGGRVLIHCGAGIGRTGMLALCVLLALGEPQTEAEQVVSASGSHPETAEQRALVSWCVTRCQGTR